MNTLGNAGDNTTYGNEPASTDNQNTANSNTATPTSNTNTRKFKYT